MKPDKQSNGPKDTILDALHGLTVGSLAALLALNIDPRWGRGDGYAVGPCPIKCSPLANVALAYPVLGGWAPWLRCTSCGHTVLLEDLLIEVLGSRDHAALALDWAIESPTPEGTTPTSLAEIERYFSRDKLITRSAQGVTADAIVLGADERLSRRSRKPMIVFDLGIFFMGEKVRVPFFVPFALEHLLERALAALGASREGLDLRALVGRVARAGVGAVRGDFGGWRSNIGFLKESTRELVWVADARRLIAACAAEGRRP